MHLSKIEKRPAIGDYVFCSKWSDRSPSDSWHVGILEEIVDSRDDRRYFVVKGNNGNNRRYPNCQVISHIQGVLILGFYPSLEGSDWKTWKDRIKSLEDQDVIKFFNWFLNPRDPNVEC